LQISVTLREVKEEFGWLGVMAVDRVLVDPNVSFVADWLILVEILLIPLVDLKITNLHAAAAANIKNNSLVRAPTPFKFFLSPRAKCILRLRRRQHGPLKRPMTAHDTLTPSHSNVVYHSQGPRGQVLNYFRLHKDVLLKSSASTKVLISPAASTHGPAHSKIASLQTQNLL
jgi:hypothetical protein